MNTINLNKEALEIVENGVNVGIAAVWRHHLYNHFNIYGADRIMTKKEKFDRSYVDISISEILKKYGYSINDIKDVLDTLWKKQKTNYNYYLLAILYVDIYIKVGKQ
jgi:hypothetical protein